MTIPSSGQISFDRLKDEFAGGANSNISLAAYYTGAASGYVPAGTSASIPSSGAISMNNFYDTSLRYVNTYLINGTYPSVSGRVSVEGGFNARLAVDSGGNTTVVGAAMEVYDYGSYMANILVVKYNVRGEIVFRKHLMPTLQALAYYPLAYGVAVDSADNIYVVGGTEVQRPYLMKLNSSGDIQWARMLYQGDLPSTAVGGVAYDIKIDSSDNIYICGQHNSTTAQNFTRDSVHSSFNVGTGFLAKYNTSGTIQWQRKIGISNSSDWQQTAMPYGLGLDSSGNVFVCGYRTGTESYSSTSFLMKYNSSGTLQWQKILSNEVFLEYMAVDNSGNMAIVGRDSYATPIGAIVFYFNSSGTLQWQRKLSLTNYQLDFSSVDIDNSGNVYCSGRAYYATGMTYSLGLLACFNSSGTLQWQRTFGSATASYYYNSGGITVNRKTNNLYINGCIPDQLWIDSYNFSHYMRSGYILKTRLDGTPTKTVTNTGLKSGTAISASSFTNSTPTYTVSAGNMSDAAGSATEAAHAFTAYAGGGSFTIANSTFTNYTTTF